MTEEIFSVIQDVYGYAMILARGIFFGLLAGLFIDKEVLSTQKSTMLSAAITIEGAVLFTVPVQTRRLWGIIGFVTVAAIFLFYDKKHLPHISFVYFLWMNVFYVWFLISIVLSDIFSGILIETINYNSAKVMELVYGRMTILLALETIFAAAFFALAYFSISKLCEKKYDMSWTEAVYLSVFSAISYFIVYMIAEVMVVPLKKEVFVLLDEKKNLKIMLPLLAIFILAGELSAIATWQRYRRLKEEELLLHKQLQEQEYIKRRIDYTEKYNNRIRTLRHDMSGKLMILKSFLLNQRYQEAAEFLGNMEIELNAGEFRFATGNPVTDVVINEAAALCERLECRFDCDFSFSDDMEINATDIAIVLNNLLDNALEAVAAVQKSVRYIRISGNVRDNFFLIRSENPYGGALIRAADNTFKSKKKIGADTDIHGIGLKSVMGIAEKYLGTMDIKTYNNIFEVRVMLQGVRK